MERIVLEVDSSLASAWRKVPAEIKRQLERLLTSEGFEDLMIGMEENEDSHIQIDMEITKDRRNELRDYINKNALDIFA